MPRGFHPSPQLFRIPEDADANELDDDDEILQPSVFSPVVWVAIQRDDCILVDIGEEDVPSTVIETAQGLLWENTEESVGWTEYDQSDDIEWKGLRYNDSPWSFSCVYNSKRLSKLECRRWILDQVQWTATVRTADPVWLNGDHHACQTLFAPLLQERLQDATSSARGPLEELTDDSDLPSNNLFVEEGEECENVSDGMVEIEDCWEALPVVPEVDRNTKLSKLPVVQYENEANRDTRMRSVTFRNENVPSPTTPPRQSYGSPPSSKGSRSTSSPRSTEELVKRLAIKQAELDRRRQEEREKRGPTRKERVQGSSAIEKASDNGHDGDSGSLTSATADDDEEYAVGSPSIDDQIDSSKPWNCWFLPSLPHAKSGALAP